MSAPRVPDEPGGEITLSCGRSVGVDALDMGMREFPCRCGDDHAVVMDVHPLSRWVPEPVVDVLVETIVPDDEYDEFGTIHLMAIVREELPDRVVAHDTSEDPSVGFALCWVSEFSARRLHEIIVELLIELMDHAVSHTDDDAVRTEFTEQLASFDVETFVTLYRDQRDLERR